MAGRCSSTLAKYALALLVCVSTVYRAQTQTIAPESEPPLPHMETLGLSPGESSKLKQALSVHDYIAAEKLLLPAIKSAPDSARAARLLSFAGEVYFLDRDYLNAAVAWKKSDAITPLPTQLKFSLSMTYIRLGRPDWARPVLSSLEKQEPKDALYPYWLGRLDYDAHHYDQAVAQFKQAIALNAGMARAFDNLGLCYFYQNKNALALASYNKAIALDHNSARPSAWPYLNLAIALEFMNQTFEAEVRLREAIRIDPRIASAHFELGNVLETKGKTEAAILEFREAARLDPNYAEPHFALARIDRRLGRSLDAQKEVQIYLRIHDHSAAGAPQNSTRPAN